ncbi:trehalose operon repressor [Alkaliphilus transvaalensis]|uniref:trehalose operon repressor n=1 Tax=Alkaliphilus transvaalensis TaxID=114628 RepID=UPI00047EDAD0|nr:trehalose operon repressor [Alkaliphilus transvaalensis]
MDHKYINIYNKIINKIENGMLEPKEKLPSENELMQEYHVSRDTIRKALDLLERNGFILKVKGKGSFVLDINKFEFPVSGLTSFKELAQKINVESETIVKECALINPNDYLMKHLNVSKEDKVWKVIRVRKIGGQKIILDKDYLNMEFVPHLTEEICKDSIYQYIENDLGLRINFAKKEITVQQATEEDQQYLDFDNYNMIVVVKNYIYLDNGSLFQFTESRHRPDKFRFIDFAKRQHL